MGMTNDQYAAAQDRAARYGVAETNGMTEEVAAIRNAIDHGNPVLLEDRDLARIVRLRLLSDRGFPFWDVSYCYGQMKDGTYVRVSLPWGQIPKKGGLNANIVKMCKEVGVYGKGLGIFDVISTLQ